MKLWKQIFKISLSYSQICLLEMNRWTRYGFGCAQLSTLMYILMWILCLVCYWVIQHKVSTT